MKKIPLFLLSISTFAAFGQKVSYSVHAGSALPIIGTVERSIKVQATPVSSAFGSTFLNAGTLRETFDSKAGFCVSGRVTIKTTSAFLITTGLAVQGLRYSRSVTVENMGNETMAPALPTRTAGSPFSSFFTVRTDGNGNLLVNENGLPVRSEPLFSKPNGSVTNMFIQVPILAGTSLLNNKLGVKVGTTVSYLAYASSYKQNLTRSYADQYPTVVESKEKAKDDFTPISAGLLTEISYQPVKRWMIDLSFQKNLNALYAGTARSGGKAKLNVLSLGIGYSISK
jgi:hypothetical protein